MAYTAYVTNTSVRPLTLYFRPPNPGAFPIPYNIAPRALNQPVIFSNEEHFNLFKQQVALQIATKRIIVNGSPSTKEKEAVKINEANAQAEVKSVKAKKDKIVADIEAAVETDGVSLKTEVKKVKSGVRKASE